MKKLVWLAAAIAGLSACGDNHDSTPDGPPVTPDGPPDGPAPFVLPTPISVPLSMEGPDQLQSAAAAPDGKFYAAGFSGAAVTGPRFVTVVKFSTTGPDTTFGTQNGTFTSTVPFVGGADEVDIATQPSGKIIVTATVANSVNAADRDIAVMRLTTQGALDTTFGENGVRIVDLNTAVAGGSGLVGLDAARAVAIDPEGRIYIHAASRRLGMDGTGNPFTDTDFTVARLTAEGAIDTAWGTDGKFQLDILGSNATPRAIRAFADGTVIASGYANSTAVNSVQAVLYKLTSAGGLDTSWATGGFFHEVVLAIQTEIYGFTVHGNFIVTGGYGRNTGTANDYISMRFNLATGVRDLTWGTAGAALVDPSGTMLGSNCRNAIALSNGRTALIGSTGPSNMPTQDAVVVILDENGRVDTSTYGDGIHTFPLGSNGNDQFWGGTVSGNTAVFVGYKGGGMTQTAQSNDDSYVVLLPLR